MRKLLIAVMLLAAGLVVAAPQVPAKGWWFQFKAAHSGKCLDMGGKDNGAPLQQWDCSGAANQRFELKNASGPVNIVVRSTGKCLDVPAGKTGNGVKLQQWNCSGGENQKFKLEPAGGNRHRIVAVQSGKCLDVSGASQDNGARVQLWDCSGGQNQLWELNQVQ